MTMKQAHLAAAEALQALHPTSQCASVYATRSGATFCAKREGHGGDHRGYRTQWNAAGQRVPITEPDPTSVRARRSAT